MRLSAALLGLIVMLHPPRGMVDCTTACGMKAVVTSEECMHLQVTESVVVNKYRLYTSEADALCERLHGWTINIHQHTWLDTALCRDRSADAWWDDDPNVEPMCVTGLTHYESKIIILPDTKWDHNAFTHEIGHVIDTSSTSPHWHCAWGARGFKVVIQDVTGEDDETDESCQ